MGENVDEIQKHVNKLRIEAAQKGFLPTSRSSRGRLPSSPMSRGFRGGGYSRGSPYPRGRGSRGRGRGRGYPGHTTLDRRPTSIMVTDVGSDLKDAVLGHMSKFGEIV